MYLLPPLEVSRAEPEPPVAYSTERPVLFLATMLKDVTMNTDKYLAGQTYSVARGVLETLRSLGAVS